MALQNLMRSLDFLFYWLKNVKILHECKYFQFILNLFFSDILIISKKSRNGTFGMVIVYEKVKTSCNEIEGFSKDSVAG
jgi:hypothetical protein